MMPIRLLRPAAFVLMAAGLSACGFHLRNKLALPADVPAVKVESAVRYSELVKLLNRGLRSSGAMVVEEDEAAPGDVSVDEAPRVATASLKIRSERWGDMPIAIDARGRAQEYSLRYAVVFTFLRPDGSVLVPEQAIEMSRDYVSQPNDATGTTTEREILADELRREMSASILRRIDSVTRAEIRRGHSLEGAGEATPPDNGNGDAD